MTPALATDSFGIYPEEIVQLLCVGRSLVGLSRRVAAQRAGLSVRRLIELEQGTRVPTHEELYRVWRVYAYLPVEPPPTSVEDTLTP